MNIFYVITAPIAVTVLVLGRAFHSVARIDSFS